MIFIAMPSSTVEDYIKQIYLLEERTAQMEIPMGQIAGALGVVPGTRLVAEMASPTGDPTAYRIRGALIALRRDQQRWIRVRDIAEDADDENTNSELVANSTMTDGGAAA